MQHKSHILVTPYLHLNTTIIKMLPDNNPETITMKAFNYYN